MLSAVFFFGISVLLGRALIKKAQLHLPGVLGLVSALVMGTVALCVLLFAGGFIFGLPKTFVVITLLLVGGAATVVLKRDVITLLIEVKTFIVTFIRRWSWRERLLTLFLVGLLLWLFGRALFIDPNGSLIAGDRLVWTDWPVHIGMASSFAWGQSASWRTFPQNPTFAGIPLIYPFFADFLSGVLLALGSAYPAAFSVPGIVLTGSFFALFISFAGELYKEFKASREAKLLMGAGALALSLFWGGLGWLFWLREAFSSEVQLIERLLVPPREYTFWAEKGLWFFTFVFSEILPQRAFLFGLPLFFLILILIRSAWEKGHKKNYVAAGILSGLLPFFHTHSFLSVLFLTVTWAVLGGIIIFLRHRQHTRRYLEAIFLYFLPFVTLAIVQAPLFLSQSQGLPFEFGWLKGKENFFLFWFKNTGFFWPLLVLGIWKGKFSGFTKSLGIANMSLFILPNLFRFAPWNYDNLKILTFWYLIGSIFVIAALAWIGKKGRWAGRLIAILLFISLTLSGIVEVGRLLDTPKKQIGLWSREDQEFAKQIREKTSPQAIFLTAAIHDHPVTALAGRYIILGFPGNSWSWGIRGWDERERDVHTMFRGGEKAGSLWKKYKIDYIIVGDRERWFESELDEGYIAANADLYFEQGKTKVYKIR